MNQTAQNNYEHRNDGGVGGERTRSEAYFRPNVDIVEGKDALTIMADLPGSSPEKIDLDFENGKLTIRAQVEKRQPDRGTFLLREYGVGDFVRSFEISEQIDAAKISADYTNGVLTLTLPRAETAKPRKIAVKGN